MKGKSVKLSFALISKYRAVLMGIAILAILFCHVDTALEHHDMSVTRLASCLHIFTVGVDIFMFLSGFGLYYSCAKKPCRYLEYVQKRVSRIVPTYLMIAGITLLVSDILIKKLPFGRLFEDLFFVSWIKRGTTIYWFIAAIVVFYLVFPVLYRLASTGKRVLIKFVLFTIAFWIATMVLGRSFENYQRFRIAIERLPIFFLGACCGKLSKEDREMHLAPLLIVTVTGYAASVLQYLLHPYRRWISKTHFMYYCSRGILSLAIIISVIAVMELLEKRKPTCFEFLNHMLSVLGGITLEIYLFHQSFMILFDFPVSAAGYLLAGVILPLVCASLVYILKHSRNKQVLKQ